MRLTKVRVQNYRSIEDSGVVDVQPDITALVGKNESGKTAFLRRMGLLALESTFAEREVRP